VLYLQLKAICLRYDCSPSFLVPGVWKSRQKTTYLSQRHSTASSPCDPISKTQVKDHTIPVRLSWLESGKVVTGKHTVRGLEAAARGHEADTSSIGRVTHSCGDDNYCVRQLFGTGKNVRLNDPVEKYLPELPNGKEDITVRRCWATPA